MAMLWIRDTLPFATVAAAARFVPIPLMDDVVKSAATRAALARLLTTRGDQVTSSELKPLYSTGSILGTLLRFPLKLLLYPIRKIVKIISAARGVPRDFLEVFLLVRCVDTALERGLFAVEGKRRRRKRAKVVRKAFNEAFDGTDLSLLSAVLGEALDQAKSLGQMASVAASNLVDRGGETPEEREEADQELAATFGGAEDAQQLAEDVEELLGRSDVEAVLLMFDKRFRQELDERI